VNALDAIVTLALDVLPCQPNETLPELCEIHSTEMQGDECRIIATRRREMRSALNDAMPDVVEWIAGLIEDAADEVADSLPGSDFTAFAATWLRNGAIVVRDWDYRAEIAELSEEPV
jgi:hypothetical protein